MKLLLIRHGMTQGNLEKRYIGRTDEPLCAEGRTVLLKQTAVPCSRVFASPMKRCLETAEILYPGQEPVICQDLRERDFGAYEGKNYKELSKDARYQAWIDSNGTLPFPEGEDQAAFEARSCGAFWELVDSCREEEVLAFLVHGGTIMALLAAYGEPGHSMYDYQVKNGSGYLISCSRKERRLRILQKLGD